MPISYALPGTRSKTPKSYAGLGELSYVVASFDAAGNAVWKRNLPSPLSVKADVSSMLCLGK